MQLCEKCPFRRFGTGRTCIQLNFYLFLRFSNIWIFIMLCWPPSLQVVTFKILTCVLQISHVPCNFSNALVVNVCPFNHQNMKFHYNKRKNKNTFILRKWCTNFLSAFLALNDWCRLDLDYFSSLHNERRKLYSFPIKPIEVSQI